jgi:hypothetical protein
MLTTVASAQDLLWDNYPFGFGGGYMSSQLDLVYPFDSQTADDFMTSGMVQAIEWNGGFWGGSPVDVPDWNIIFYADAGGKPTGGPEDPTGTALALYIAPLADINVTMEGDGSYTYYYELPDEFAASGEVQWVAVQPVFPFPPQWGISVALDSIQMTEVQFGFPLLGNPYWTPGSVVFGTARDMCFRLYGIPAPGALALLGLAGLVGTRRR